MKTINPQTAKAWLTNNEAILIDVREPAEFKAIHIAGAHLIPVGDIDNNKLPPFSHKKIIVHCKLGMRGKTACQKLLDNNPDLEIYNMEGGIMAWEKAGFEVEKTGKEPISILRQVQMVAGSGVLLGLLLALFVNTGFLWITAFFGAGLLFSGITGQCPMATLIEKMPWNQKQ